MTSHHTVRGVQGEKTTAAPSRRFQQDFSEQETASSSEIRTFLAMLRGYACDCSYHLQGLVLEEAASLFHGHSAAQT